MYIYILIPFQIFTWKNWCFTKHPLRTGCLGFQVRCTHTHTHTYIYIHIRTVLGCTESQKQWPFSGGFHCFLGDLPPLLGRGASQLKWRFGSHVAIQNWTLQHGPDFMLLVVGICGLNFIVEAFAEKGCTKGGKEFYSGNFYIISCFKFWSLKLVFTTSLQNSQEDVFVCCCRSSTYF